MVINKQDMTTDVREKMRGGSGSVELMHVVPSDALPSKSRLFSVITLQPGCGIGTHEHTDEAELFYVLEGEGVICDNGEDMPFVKGSSHVCGSGESHGVTNTGDKPLVFIAAIILD